MIVPAAVLVDASQAAAVARALGEYIRAHGPSSELEQLHGELLELAATVRRVDEDLVWVSCSEAAMELGVSARTARRWAQAGRVPAKREEIGNGWRIGLRPKGATERR